MIKNITVALIVTFFIIFTLTAIILSTLGVETNRFNNLITKKINQSNTNIELKLNKIKFKLDVKEISLFLETTNPLIYYRSIEIPSKNIKVSNYQEINKITNKYYSYRLYFLYVVSICSVYM